MNSSLRAHTLCAARSNVFSELRERWPQPARDSEELARRLDYLVASGLDVLPLPGAGDTAGRWGVLAEVAALDLGLLKLFEGHTDALAIMAELGHEPPGAGPMAVWAAEPPGARVVLEPVAGCHGETVEVELSGRKAWCSGAAVVGHGLMTAWRDESQYLVAVPMDQRGVTVTGEGWSAVGMAPTGSVEVLLERARGTLVGGADAYLSRPGFWHGGAGIAACWWGAATRIGEALLAGVRQRSDAHALAHLGAVDAALSAGAATLRESARWIDARPDHEARALALSTRATLEDVVDRVLHHAGRALGAGPFCRDPLFARLAADLPVFVRQSHAERDLERLGDALAVSDSARPWAIL